MFNILQDWSTPVSSTAFYTSNTSNYLLNLVNNPPNTTGTVLYLNYSVTVSPYKGLEIVSDEATATNLNTPLTGNTNDIPIAQFQTDFTLPTFINSGFWDMNLFAYSTDNSKVSVYATLYKRNGVTETSLATSSGIPITVPTSVTQVTMSLYLPYTDLVAGDTLVLKLFANNTGSPAQSINTYFEGTNYSHLHTTLGTVVAVDALTSTVNGLSQAGYISSARLNVLSNYYHNLLQDWSTPVSTVATYTSNTSNYSSNILQDWSTALSSVARFTSNTSGSAAAANTDWSTAVSTVSKFTSNTSNWAVQANQNWSTPVSSVGTFTSNTSNWASNILQNWSTSVSSVGTFTSNTSNWASNILQNWSTPVSSVATFTSNTSNWGSNILQNWSVSVSSVGTFTSNASNYTVATSNYAANILQNWSTPVSSVGTFSSNASNYAVNILQNWSTAVSSVGTFTSNASNYTVATSNYAANILQNWSTPVSSVGTFTSNTSNYLKNTLQDWSTPVSSVGTFTSNTSNYLKNTLQDWSTPVSSVGTFTSNTSNYLKNTLQNWSTPVSSVATFTSNTSNYAKNILQDWSTPVSSVAQFTSNTSNNPKWVGTAATDLNMNGHYITTSNSLIVNSRGSLLSFEQDSTDPASQIYIVHTGGYAINISTGDHGGGTISIISDSNVTVEGDSNIIFNSPYTTTTGNLGVNTHNTSPQYALDVNGPSRGAIIYSTLTAASPTIYPNEYYGVYYNLTGGGGALTVNLSLTNARVTSNYGKYVVFRNNGGADATVTFTGAVSGVTPPAGTTLYSNTSITLVVASNATTSAGSFVLF